MNPWMTLRKALCKNPGLHFEFNVQCHPECELTGEITIGANTTVGKSKIISKNGFLISIGKNANIRDHILMYTENKDQKKENAIYIGNRVYISSSVEIYGPVVIADETFIGSKTMIVNSQIGKGCLIEDNVLIKNIIIPSNVVIPSSSVIDSEESLNKILSDLNQGEFCQLEPINTNGKLT